MAIATKANVPIEDTEHPPLVKRADTIGGEARIEDRRFAIRHVVRLFDSVRDR